MNSDCLTRQRQYSQGVIEQDSLDFPGFKKKNSVLRPMGTLLTTFLSRFHYGLIYVLITFVISCV